MSIDLLRQAMWGEHAEFIALVISIAIESLFSAKCAKFLKLNGKLLAIITTAGTLITHPVMWNLFSSLSPYLSFAVGSLLLEIIVFLVEGFIYKLATPYSWKISRAC